MQAIPNLYIFISMTIDSEIFFMKRFSKKKKKFKINLKFGVSQKDFYLFLISIFLQKDFYLFLISLFLTC